MDMYYILDKNKKTILVHDFEEWCKLFKYEDDSRRVGDTQIGDTRISTVFLGIDHSHFMGRPLLFETMIFSNNEDNGYQERYSTWEEAIEGHNKTVELVKSGELSTDSRKTKTLNFKANE